MTAMNFNTTNSTFRQLMGNGLSYRVPPFQRDYAWTEDEWDDLWQDMVALFEEDCEPTHYMGYLVLQSADNKSFDIIDGQQRITTLSIMILASLSLLKDFEAAGLDAGKNQRRREQLQVSYIGYINPVTLVSQPKLSLNRHNYKFYQTYLVPLEKLPQRGLNPSEHLLRKAFGWFKDRLKKRVGTLQDSGMKLAAFLDSLVDKLFFTVITVTDELNAFKVFETLNARGVRLSTTDLLKNYLFSVLSTEDTHEAELRSLEDRWEHITGLLGRESFPDFLRVFWNSRNKAVRKSDLFKTIRKKIADSGAAFQLLRDLDQMAEVYASLRDPKSALWDREEKEALEQLSMFNVRQPLAMLMACHNRFFERERSAFTHILKAVAVVSFRYNVICNLPAHEQESVYDKIAFDVSNRESIMYSEVTQALMDVYPNDDKFKAAFAEKAFLTTNSRNKKVLRYILFAIERQKSGCDFDFESAKYNIEHILPEKPSQTWSHIEEAKQNSLIYRIGNMTPLETALNREIGNDGYDVKRSSYARSAFQITRAVAEHYDSWDENKIDARQKRLAQAAAGIWKIN